MKKTDIQEMNEEQRLTFVIMKANTIKSLMYDAINRNYQLAYKHWAEKLTLTLIYLKNMLIMRGIENKIEYYIK